MNDEEFDIYVSNLKIALYLPKRIPDEERGLFYCTLPTTKPVGAKFYINLPLELTTGRNEVLDNSAYNKAIWRILFRRDGTKYSIMNYLFCYLVRSYKDLELYDYFQGNVNKGLLGQGDIIYFAVTAQHPEYKVPHRPFGAPPHCDGEAKGCHPRLPIAMGSCLRSRLRGTLSSNYEPISTVSDLSVTG